MNEFWLDYEQLVSRYIWAPIWKPDAYIPSSLLQMKDRNGNTPGIFIACSFERGPGKTFAFTYKLIRDFLDSEQQCKFIVIARQQTEVGFLAHGMFKPMLELMFPGWYVYEKQKMHGKYSEIFLANDFEKKSYSCGYVCTIYAADEIKKVSGHFADAYQWYFDEFQPMDESKYLPDEPEKFKVLIQSFGRGGGSHVRVVPGYMASNTMSVMNDYFLAMGISNKVQPNTKKYKGDGFVLQVVSVPGLKQHHESNPVLIALSGGREQLKQKNDDRWLNDNTTNIIKYPKGWGNSIYMCTIAVGERRYGVRYFSDKGLWWIDYRVDPSCNSIYDVMLGDNVNLPLLKQFKIFDMMKTALRAGVMYFASPVCKKAVMAFMR